jgi:hypothetical protein
MADRLTLRDLAQALAAAGRTEVAEGARVVALRLRLPMLVRAVPEGDALWDMVLHHRPRRRTAPLWLLRWRRIRRRRAGWAPSVIDLHWNRYGVVACRDARRLAALPEGVRP